MSSSQKIEFFPIKFEEIETTKELLKLNNDQFPVYVNCFIPNCPPCVGMKTALEDSNFNKPIKLYYVNLAEDEFLQQDCKIISAPAFIIFDKDKDNNLVLIKQDLINDLNDFCDFFKLIMDEDF